MPFFKVLASLFFGSILILFNYCLAITLGVACIENFFNKELHFPIWHAPDGVVWGFVAPLSWNNIFLITPVLTFRICWMAVNDDAPLEWCRRNRLSFLLAFLSPFINYLIVATFCESSGTAVRFLVFPIAL
ncbi:MAG: hypothetical protein NT138_06415 [Planctomycetales bacterium]|nr:hypothetical protein [Planctomycetales bacterium]